MYKTVYCRSLVYTFINVFTYPYFFQTNKSYNFASWVTYADLDMLRLPF
jgi:hypothetical protein